MTVQQSQKQCLTVKGMDCTECAVHTEEAVRGVPRVRRARVYLARGRGCCRAIDPNPACYGELSPACTELMLPCLVSIS